MPTPPDAPLPSTAGAASANPPEPGTEILVALCRRWQDARARGADLDPEQLCRDHPDLLPDLRMAIEVLAVVSGADPTDPARGSTVEIPAAGSPPRLAGFEVSGILGGGAMGIVYKARQAGLNRDVAIKVVRGPHRDDARSGLRFLAEAEAAAAVTHPNVVRVHGYGEADGHPYLVLEYLGGGTLAGRLAAGRLDPRAAAALVARIAAGVQAAHDQGIVHRDLKPGNILFDDAGEPKVADFGLAKFGGADLTHTGVILGTPAYMAPEQARGETKFVGPGADVWALGVILYECLTGGRPFDAADRFALLRRVIQDDPPRPGKVVAVPRDVELICLKCLAKSPADRYPTAAALADDLARFLADRPIRARPPSAADAARRLVRRHPLPAALAAGLALTVAAGLVGTTTLYLRAAEARDAADANATRADANATRADVQAARADEKAALAGRTVDELLLALGNDLIDTTDIPKVRLSMYLRALALYDQFAADPGGPTPAVTAKRAEARAQIAALRNGLGQPDEARADYEEALRLFRSPGGGGNPRLEAATAESYAAFLRKTGRPADALRLLDGAADRLAAAGAARDDEDVAADRLRVAGLLGTLLAEAGQSDRSRAAFRDATDRGAAARTAHPDWARLRLADARLRAVYADALAVHFRRPDEAVPLYEAALAVFRPAQLADPGRVSAATDLVKCLENYAVCLGRAGKTDDGRRARDDALAVWDRLVGQFPDTPEYRLNRAIALTNTAAHAGPAALGDRTVEARLREAATDLEWLADRYPRVPEYRDRLAAALSNLAVLFTGTGRAVDAVPLFDRARLHVYALAPAGPAAAAERDGFFRLLKGRGLALWTLDRHDEAAESFAEAAKFAPAPLDWDEATALRLCMAVRGGRATDALREAVRLRGEGKLVGRGSVHAAAVFAEGAASSAVKGPEAKEALQQRAVGLIRAGVDAGYADAGQLRTQPAFRELVGRADFLEQVRRAEEKARPAKD